MKNIFILIYFIHSITAKLTTIYECRDCLGKIHNKKDLELAKRPLLINKKQICQNENSKFIIIIKSGTFQRRNFTRSTWAKELIEHVNIPILYAIGYTLDRSIQKEIIAENNKYEDLLQFDILESYYNLTIKTTSVLFWYNKYCSKTSHYLLYVDDDILIHVDKLITYMNGLNNSNIIEGWFEKSGKIQRTGIGGVSKENFPIDIVPDYLWGAAVLYPSNIISNILMDAIFNTDLPIFFRDDAFINGFIAEQAGIQRQQMKGILLYDKTEDDLKSNIIIIDFKTEANRVKAWNCYKYNIHCNKNLLLLIGKILLGICLAIMIIIFCWKYFKTTKFWYTFKYELHLWYYGITSPYMEKMISKFTINTNKRSTIGIRQAKVGFQWLINFRRMLSRLGFLFLISIVLYYLVKNK